VQRIVDLPGVTIAVVKDAKIIKLEIVYKTLFFMVLKQNSDNKVI